MVRSLTEEEALAFSNGTHKAKKLKVPSDQLQEEVARRMNLYPEDIATIWDATMGAVLDFMMFSDRDTSVEVAVNKDLSFLASFVPAHVTKNGSKQDIYVDDMVKIQPKISKDYFNKCNQGFLSRLEIKDISEQFEREREAKLLASE